MVRFLCVLIKLCHKYFAEVAEQLKKKERRKHGMISSRRNRVFPRTETHGNHRKPVGKTRLASPRILCSAAASDASCAHARLLSRVSAQAFPCLQFPVLDLSPAFSYLPRARPRLAQNFSAAPPPPPMVSARLLSRVVDLAFARAQNFPHQPSHSHVCALGRRSRAQIA
jgi:hypothetical protein